MEQLLREVKNEYGTDAGKKAAEVVGVVRAKVTARNLFGWRSYIEDMLIDLVGYMIATEFQYSGGAYVACGMQSAIDHSRYCSAKKRRAQFEGLSSLEDWMEANQQKEDTRQRTQEQDILIDIRIRFGSSLAEKLRPFILGYELQLSEEVLKICRSKEFMEWLREYTEAR